MPDTEFFDMEKFKKDGYVVVEDFLSDDDIKDLKSECHKLVIEMDPKEHCPVFSFSDLKEDQLLTSADQISFFFEEAAFDADGNLKVDKHLALSRIGHGMHALNPTFKRISTSQKVKDLANFLSLVNPVIAQSTYIFKQPYIGCKANMHQDATYLNTAPVMALYGLWFALEDATEENGCLSFMPGSHTDGLWGERRVYLRSKQPDGRVKLEAEGIEPQFPHEQFVPCPVKKGSMILFHGLVMHKSEENRSDKPRPIYTFHIYDAGVTKWDERNWIQPTEKGTFIPVFETGEQRYY